MDQICFRADYFYTFMIVGVAVIAFVIYKLYSDSQNYLDKLQLVELVKQDLKERGQAGNRIADKLAHELAIRDMIEDEKNKDMERLVNPLVPPLRRDEYLPGGPVGPRVPINIPTRGEYGAFHQVGMLTKTGETDPEQMMPLIGRRIHSDQWEYHTVNHMNTNLKIPLTTANRGRKELYDGDTIGVPGYKDEFKVTIYDSDSPLYIPY